MAKCWVFLSTSPSSSFLFVLSFFKLGAFFLLLNKYNKQQSIKLIARPSILFTCYGRLTFWTRSSQCVINTQDIAINVMYTMLGVRASPDYSWLLHFSSWILLLLYWIDDFHYVLEYGVFLTKWVSNIIFKDSFKLCWVIRGWVRT